jgi:hypothetical protein
VGSALPGAAPDPLPPRAVLWPISSTILRAALPCMAEMSACTLKSELLASSAE